MVKAFKLPGYMQEQQNTEAMGDVDDNDSENDDTDSDLMTVTIDFDDEDEFMTYESISLPERVSCFSHTVQLVVKDGLQDAGSQLKAIISKASSLVSHV